MYMEYCFYLGINIWKKNTHSWHFRGTCTSTGSVVFFYFDKCSYFGHNLLISDPI